MTQNISGWLPNLLGVVELQADGVALTARGALNFVGCEVTDSGSALSISPNPALGTVATANATPVYVTLATLAVGDVAVVDVVAKVKNASGSVRQSCKLSGLYYGAAGPTATIDGSLSTTSAGTGAAAVTLDVSGATVRLKITGIAATDLVTTYDASVI